MALEKDMKEAMVKLFKPKKDAVQKFREFEIEYAEKFNREVEKREAEKREAEKRYHDLVITY